PDPPFLDGAQGVLSFGARHVPDGSLGRRSGGYAVVNSARRQDADGRDRGMGGHRGGLPRVAGARARVRADVAHDVGDLPNGDAAAPGTFDRVRRVAVDRVASVRPRLELLLANVMVPAGEIWRRIIPPLVTTFVVFLLLVRYHIRHAEPTEPPQPPIGGPVFVRYLLTTVAAGYGMFLAI